jgi:hypothetical protein
MVFCCAKNLVPLRVRAKAVVGCAVARENSLRVGVRQPSFGNSGMTILWYQFTYWTAAGYLTGFLPQAESL